MLEADVEIGQLYVLAGSPRGQVYKKVKDGVLCVDSEGVNKTYDRLMYPRPHFEVLPHYTFKQRLEITHRLLVALEAGDGRDSENPDPAATEEYEAAIKAYCVMANMIYCVVSHQPPTLWRNQYFQTEEEKQRVMERRAAHQWVLECYHPDGRVKTTRRGTKEALTPFIEVCDEWNVKHARV
ncbi:hypothetical protein HWB92_gp064 [Serratia phage vB_SmaA_3M]|uniref:Uncharacterized protein n=4 Tax=Miltonvirus TaxID=2841278 RepID=K7YB24_9CAUD|nr:hypothetical protein G646_gp064 [Serratia phage phiMAM1]YP_009841932.1 hypothetical protein HWB92_gp064 [Serratia phage vB_SmaA_3M]ASZ78835.1 hypothetical protein 2050H1_069 [Serratia phage 2050H1]BAH15174.1 hypothetical protein [Serratia phage KSP90]AFX93532.1 hypothetical protein MAM_064 [Serratia phage phiMAM1]AYP28322.1 hypothetical protein 3M_066 [Serratia phage vB_SmaA_3M]